MSSKDLNKNEKNKNNNLGVLLLILGLLIIFLVAINGFNMFNSFSLNSQVIATPSIFKYQEDQGREYQNFYKEYNKFINEIESFNLDELNKDDFKEKDNYYIYSFENYDYEASNNYIKVIKDEKEVYYNVIEDDVQTITLYSDKEYELEIGPDLITFSYESLKYEFDITSNGYILKCDYLVDTYNAYEEVYDKDFNLELVKIKIGEFNYEGYLVDNIEGYSLTTDKSMLCKDETNECELSTKYLENSETIYYTLVDYFFNSVYSKDMLLVKENEVFPFR